MKENRKHERVNERLEVKVTWPGKKTIIGRTLNFSDGGTFIEVSFDLSPPTGTEMLLQLNGPVMGGEAPILKARVVRTTPRGIAFQFIKDEMS